jgi:hypothetical protein
MQHLQGIYDSVTTANADESVILLIAKIESSFPDSQKLRLDDLLNERLQHFED